MYATPIRCSLAAVLLAAATRADVLAVGPGGFPTIQEAVDAAADGDTIVVVPGTYPGFTVEAKGLTIVAEDGIANTGRIVVRNVGPQQAVLLQNLEAKATPSLGDGGDLHVGLLVEQCAGFVRLADCTFRGAFTFSCLPYWNSGVVCPSVGHGARLRGARDVAFVRCVLDGTDASWWSDSSCLCSPGIPAGAGLWDAGGTTVLQHCELLGGHTGGSEGWGNWGGHGYRGEATTLFAEGNVFRGGNGGSSEIDGQGGPGGHGLWFTTHANAHAFLRDNDALGGQGGPVFFDPPYTPGPDGAPFELEGGFTLWTGKPTRLDVESPVRAAEPTTVRAAGEPGTFLFLALSEHDGSLPLPGYEGWLSIGLPFQLLPAGVIPAGGELVLEPTAPDLGVDVTSLRLQAFATTDLVTVRLTNWTPLIVLAADA